MHRNEVQKSYLLTNLPQNPQQANQVRDFIILDFSKELLMNKNPSRSRHTSFSNWTISTLDHHETIDQKWILISQIMSILRWAVSQDEASCQWQAISWLCLSCCVQYWGFFFSCSFLSSIIISTTIFLWYVRVALAKNC